MCMTKKSTLGERRRATRMLYVYPSPPIHFGWIIDCLDPRAERQSQLAEVQATRAFEASPLRTRRPEEARLFFVPVWEWASLRVGACHNTTHLQRMRDLADALRAEPWFRRRGGRDHVWISSASRATIWEAHGDYALNRGRVNRMRPAWDVLRHTTPGLRKPEEFARAFESPYGTPPPVSPFAGARAARSALFAGSFDVCCVGRALRCRLSRLQGRPWVVLRRIPSVHWDGGRPLAVRCGGGVPKASEATAVALMRAHTFCLVPPGDTCVSARLYTAISQGCLPIVMCDDLRGAFHEWVPYERFTFRLGARNFSEAALERIVRGTPEATIAAMQRVLERAQQDVLWTGAHAARHAMRAALRGSAGGDAALRAYE